MTEPERLKAEIETLSPPDQLRLAADLLEAKEGELAYQIARQTVLNLGLARLGLDAGIPDMRKATP